jgi:hypothetical protein
MTYDYIFLLMMMSPILGKKENNQMTTLYLLDQPITCLILLLLEAI